MPRPRPPPRQLRVENKVIKVFLFILSYVPTLSVEFKDNVRLPMPMDRET